MLACYSKYRALRNRHIQKLATEFSRFQIRNELHPRPRSEEIGALDALGCDFQGARGNRRVRRWTGRDRDPYVSWFTQIHPRSPTDNQDVSHLHNVSQLRNLAKAL